MSLFAEYAFETRGRRSIEIEHGFATFVIGQGECYLEDIFVRPAFRKSGAAKKLADQVREIARAEGCKILIGTVNCAFTDPTTILKAMLAYGFKINKTINDVIILSMEV